MSEAIYPPDAPNGGWFCGACHSLNVRGTARCYSCETPRPDAQAERDARPRKTLAGLGLAALAVAIAIALLGGWLAARPSSTDHKPSSPVANAAQSTPSAAPSPTLMSLATASPTASAPARPTPTPTNSPSPTPRQTAAPVATAAPPAATAAPPADGVALPSIPVSVPGVSVSYYPITGTTEDELISGMLSGGAANCQIADAAACFSDSFNWSYQAVTDAGTSVCSVTKVDFQATYSMIFPQWVGPARVPPTLATWWRKVMDHVVWHESQHLAIAKSYAVKLQAAIAGGPCDQSGQQALTDPLNAQLQAAQAAFDVQDRSWTWPAL